MRKAARSTIGQDVIGNIRTVMQQGKKMKYPDLVVKLVNSCSGWIFGSACEHDNPRDYDVFIPLPFWRSASMLIPKEARINRMGGFKCISEGKEVDVWTGEMHDLLASNFFRCAFHPLTGVKIKRIAPPLNL